MRLNRVVGHDPQHLTGTHVNQSAGQSQARRVHAGEYRPLGLLRVGTRHRGDRLRGEKIAGLGRIGEELLTRSGSNLLQGRRGQLAGRPRRGSRLLDVSVDDLHDAVGHSQGVFQGMLGPYDDPTRPGHTGDAGGGTRPPHRRHGCQHLVQQQHRRLGGDALDQCHAGRHAGRHPCRWCAAPPGEPQLLDDAAQLNVMG